MHDLREEKTEAKDDRLATLVSRLLIVSLVIFPKGGLTLGGIPVSWGYMALGVLAVVLLPFRLNRFHLKNFSRDKMYFGFLLVIFLLFFFFDSSFNGFGVSIGYVYSFYATIGFMPFFFLFVLPTPSSPAFYDQLFRDLKNALLLVAVFGIVLFYYKIATGQFIGIPYLTYNSDDISALDERNGNRSEGVFKLISTYNNGNIYGVCMLMLLPVYQLAEKNLVKQLIFKMALVLTLSRTVWAVLLVYEFFRYLLQPKKNLGAVLFPIFGFAFVFAALFYAATLIHWDLSDIFDTSMGGRTVILDGLDSVTFLPMLPAGEITELVYPSFLIYYGILGLILFLVCYFLPSLYLRKGQPQSSAVQKAALAGVVIYWVTCLSDGAFLLIPVASFYWFLNWILFNPELSRWKLERARLGSFPAAAAIG